MEVPPRERRLDRAGTRRRTAPSSERGERAVVNCATCPSVPTTMRTTTVAGGAPAANASAGKRGNGIATGRGSMNSWWSASVGPGLGRRQEAHPTLPTLNTLRRCDRGPLDALRCASGEDAATGWPRAGRRGRPACRQDDRHDRNPSFIRLTPSRADLGIVTESYATTGRRVVAAPSPSALDSPPEPTRQRGRTAAPGRRGHGSDTASRPGDDGAPDRAFDVGGVVATEAVIEIYPFRTHDLAEATSRFHYWIEPPRRAAAGPRGRCHRIASICLSEHITRLQSSRSPSPPRPSASTCSASPSCCGATANAGGASPEHLRRASRIVLACFAVGLACAAMAATLASRSPCSPRLTDRGNPRRSRRRNARGRDHPALVPVARNLSGSAVRLIGQIPGGHACAQDTVRRFFSL